MLTRNEIYPHKVNLAWHSLCSFKLIWVKPTRNSVSDKMHLEQHQKRAWKKKKYVTSEEAHLFSIVDIKKQQFECKNSFVLFNVGHNFVMSPLANFSNFKMCIELDKCSNEFPMTYVYWLMELFFALRPKLASFSAVDEKQKDLKSSLYPAWFHLHKSDHFSTVVSFDLWGSETQSTGLWTKLIMITFLLSLCWFSFVYCVIFFCSTTTKIQFEFTNFCELRCSIVWQFSLTSKLKLVVSRPS